MKSFILILILLTYMISGAAVSIEDFGAIPSTNDFETAQYNSYIFVNALKDINGKDDNTLLIPKGTIWYLANCTISGLNEVSIQIDGTLIFSNEIDRYVPENGHRTAFLYFRDCICITITGSGVLDGQGLNWWRLAYIGGAERPNMFEFTRCTDITIYTDEYEPQKLLLLSSPRYSINLNDCTRVVIHDITIFIDSSIERILHRSSVMYPLNTGNIKSLPSQLSTIDKGLTHSYQSLLDGIDIAATDVTIYNVNITNYDDAIVAKPCSMGKKYCECSGNIYAYNNTITYSTGLTIGSVPPSDNINCVRNVTFKDTFMLKPLKALYIKSNPGDSGSGIVENVVYENIVIKAASWWTIYVGPQQQNQPADGSRGTGCNFLFPFVPICPTNPLVTIRDITFKNIFAYDTIPVFEGAGVILCDPLNPCTNITFDNVTNTIFDGDWEDIKPLLPIPIPGIIFPTKYRTDDWLWNYTTRDVYGTMIGPVEPRVCMEPSCFWTG